MIRVFFLFRKGEGEKHKDINRNVFVFTVFGHFI